MNWQVPLFDPDLGPEEEQALVDVIRSKWLTMGERTKEFEQRFAQEMGVPVALACNSATAALHMALAALNVGPGDDVVDLSLRVAMGALCNLTGTADTLKVGCKPADAPAGGLAFTDGVRKNAGSFKAAFPYLNTPLPGNN